MHYIRWIRFLLALMVLGPVACGEAGDVSSEAGTPEWEVDRGPLLSIGRLDGEAPYVFSGISGVRLLPEGRLAVADGASATIRIFGPDGSFIRQMGGSGEGPGEFTSLRTISFSPPDTLVAYDSRSFRVTRFLTTGELVSTSSLSPVEGFPEVYLGSFSGGGHGVAWIVQGGIDPTELSPDPMEIGRFGQDGSLERSLATGPGMRRIASPVPFSPHFLGGMIGDTVFHTDGLDGSVRAIDSAGRTVRTIEAPFQAVRPGEARSRLEAELEPTAVRELEEILETPGTDSIPVISDMLVDDAGHLWLKRYDPAADSHLLQRPRTNGTWAVVTAAGRTVAQVSVPEGFRLMDVRGDRIAGVARDSLDVQRVRVYGLQRE